MAITGFGGLGKTQLMTALASEVEASGDAPGGVYWVTAGGDERAVIESLAEFVEKLRRKRISDIDRKHVNIILLLLRQQLAKSTGRWILCIDNVDDASEPEVGHILEAIASMSTRSTRA